MSRTLAQILAALLLAGIALADFAADTTALCQGPTRLVGSEGHQAARAYVLAQLKASGLQIFEQPFRFAGYTKGRNELLADGVSLPLFPMAPNMIIPPSTPEEGVTGLLIDVGDGALSNYPYPLPAQSIIVMDYANGGRWRDAFRSGARGVIFVGAATDTALEQQRSIAPANLVRAYFDGDRTALPIGKQVTLHVSASWQPVIASNIIAVIPGTAPVFEQARGPETIVLSAPLDTSGEVPHLAPGARNAGNIAALLQIARDLQAAPARRHTVLAFLDADAWGHAGAAQFYRMFERDSILQNASLSNRRQGTKQEQEHWATVRQDLQLEDPTTGTKGPLIRQEFDDLAAEKVDRLNEAIGELRLAQEHDGVDHQPAIEAKIAAKREWNTLRRYMTTGDPESYNEVVQKRRAELITGFREHIHARSSELSTQAAAQEAEEKIKALLGDGVVSLHISLALGDTSDRWGVAIGGASLSRTEFDIDGLYARISMACQAAADAADSKLLERQSFDGSLARGDAILGTSLYTHSGAVAGMQGIFNLSFATVFDAREREGTPQDRLTALNLPRLAASAGDLTPFLRRLLDEESLSSARSIRPAAFYMHPEFDGNEVSGALAASAAGGSAMPNARTVNALVWSSISHPGMFRSKTIPGFHDGFFAFTDHSGALEMGPLPRPRRPPFLNGFAATFDQRGTVTRAIAGDTANKIFLRMNLFDVNHGAVILPASLDSTLSLSVMDARTDGAFEAKRSSVMTVDGITCWFSPDKIKKVKLFQAGQRATVAVLGATDQEQPETGSSLGHGIATSGELAGSIVSSSSQDLWSLNESRLDLLRSRGITNQSLEELHGRAQDLMAPLEAYDSLDQEQAAHGMALAIQHRSYGPIRAMLDDLVKAVLVLLALSVPFAFSLERLLIGSTKIYKQIGWFVGFFLATFLLLFVSHPAFAISQTPVIIFLGFTIIVLAALVIVIIMQRFQTELRVLQGLETTVHAADVSRLGTILAAMSMGVSSMRRRPLRTALTALTIILLTFTILGFASFGAERAVLRFYVQPTPAYPAVSTHDLSWEPLPEEVARSVKTLWGEQVPTVARRWSSSDQKQRLQAVLGKPDGKLINFDGILGISELEAATRPDFRALLSSTAAHEDSVWITRAAAQRAEVQPGDQVNLNGKQLTVGSLLDTATLTALEDIDGSSILPVDFSQEYPNEAEERLDLETAANVQKSFTAVAADAVAIVGSESARLLDAPVRALFLYPTSLEVAGNLAEDLARALPLPVAATATDGVYRHVLGTALAASGIKSLFFPLILGGLVIFGTMLGSVADRQKEIYTFSALGLAPPHVAGLFFAEALIYSIIGGLGGYLMAQGSVKVLEVVANMGLIHLPEMNYSSTNAIVTIIIVMSTVMVSAIYPAIRASRSANPGVMRAWKVPPPEGDTFALTFPFTVSQYDITGVVSFLQEHFDACSDVGMGTFMTRSSALKQRQDGQLQLDAQLALAPFDLGVTQSFSLFSMPSDIEGIDEVGIEIQRLSGQPRDWARQNKVLLDDLRTQFLLWRALPKETVEMYRLRTLEAIGTEEP